MLGACQLILGLAEEHNFKLLKLIFFIFILRQLKHIFYICSILQTDYKINMHQKNYSKKR